MKTIFSKKTFAWLVHCSIVPFLISSNGPATASGPLPSEFQVFQAHNTVTISEGTNRLVAGDHTSIVRAFRAAMQAPPKNRKHPELWDGNRAERIVQVM